MSEKGRIYIPNQNMPRICPELAAEIGLNESILLLQLDYWIGAAGKEKGGRRWVYESLSDIQEAFPFWSRSTINRTLHSLKRQQLISVDNYNRRSGDKTRWFALEYGTIALLSSVLVMGIDVSQNETPVPERDTVCQDDTDLCQNETTLPHVPHESTHEENTSEADAVWPEDSNFSGGGGSVIESVHAQTEPDPVLDLVKRKGRMTSGASWTMPAEAGGADPWANGPLRAFCRLINKPALNPSEQRKWPRQLEELATKEWGATPKQLEQAILMIPKTEHGWRTFTSPYQDGFKGVLDTVLPRVLVGGVTGIVSIHNG